MDDLWDGVPALMDRYAIALAPLLQDIARATHAAKLASAIKANSVKWQMIEAASR